MAIGRATFAVSLNIEKDEIKAKIPNDLTVIDWDRDAARGMHYVTVEGDRLPPWQRGNAPWNFSTLGMMLDYRRGNHGGVPHS